MEKFFAGFKKYAFRLELLQEYDVGCEREDFENFKRTGNVSGEDLMDWHLTIENAKIRGAFMSRVHVVKRPFCDYLRYEIEACKYNAVAGERILFLDFEEFDKLDLRIKFDYWLFDDEVVLKMVYDEEGKFLCYEEIRGDLKLYIELKDKLLSASRDFREF